MTLLVLRYILNHCPRCLIYGVLDWWESNRRLVLYISRRTSDVVRGLELYSWLFILMRKCLCGPHVEIVIDSDDLRFILSLHQSLVYCWAGVIL